MKDLENKGFRPLSSLPGGQIPDPAPGLAGLAPLGQKPANGNGAAYPGGAHGGSPFEIHAPAPAPTGQGSPFGTPQPPLPNPFQQATQTPAAAPTQQPTASPFEAAHTPQAPTPAPAAPAPEPEPAPAPVATDETGEVELSLKEVLLSVPQEKLGFDALKIPDEVTVVFPLAKIRHQLSTGRVTVRLQDVIDGCQERFQPAFAKADRETTVNLPMDSLFHQLPTEEPPASPEPAPSPAPPQAFGASPFSPAAQTPAQPAPESAASPFGIPAAPPAAAPSPANDWPVLAPYTPEPEVPTAAPAPSPAPEATFAPPSPPKPADDSAYSPFLAESDDRAEKEASGTASAENNPFAPPSAAAFGSMSSPLPAPEPPAAAPPSALWGGSEAPKQQPTTSAAPSPWDPPSAPKPAVEEHAPAAAPAPPSEPSPAPKATAPQHDPDDQLQLRALFMTSGRLDTDRIIALCEELAGIDACCLLSHDGRLCSSTINAREFGEKAKQMVTSLAALSEGLGMAESRDFTIRAGNQSITFFKAHPVFLGVRHTESDFQPGVREKLTLISRELARMV